MTNNNLTNLLLEWYKQNGRDLPWRVKGGPHPDPYVILVSELMLQQTTVKTVIPYFYRFMNRFPTVQSLAEAPLEEIYRYWQGLGYYSRARSLHETARTIINTYNGSFPQNKSELLKLKGIGRYTSASFLALAFNQPETVVDGNVIRIICRLYNLHKPVADIMPLIRSKAEALTDRNHSADYASAIMDLGAVICTPAKPECTGCPWHQACLAYQSGDQEAVPLRIKPEKQNKQGAVYLIYNSAGEIYIRKRTEKGLLSGLYEFPWSMEKTLFPSQECTNTGKKITHTFTHFKLTLQLFKMQSDTVPADGFFISLDSLKNYPTSTLMKKVWTSLTAS